MLDRILRRLRSARNRKLWEKLVADLDTPYDLRMAVEGGMLLEDGVDYAKFMQNLDYVARGGGLSRNEFYFGRDEHQDVTPTARELADPLKRPPAYPLWFVAGYPDVVRWLERLWTKAMTTDDDAEGQKVYEAMALSLGQDFSAEEMTDDEGILDHHYLRALVRAYRTVCGRRLECEI